MGKHTNENKEKIIEGEVENRVEEGVSHALGQEPPKRKAAPRTGDVKGPIRMGKGGGLLCEHCLVLYDRKSKSEGPRERLKPGREKGKDYVTAQNQRGRRTHGEKGRVSKGI